jgi:REP element-mobilizing transposase RayT
MPTKPPSRRRRNTLRLPDYDYRAAGAYFVTIVTREGECLLGEVMDEAVQLSPPGEIVRDCWLAIPDHFATVTCGEYVVMPNHLHGILWLAGPPDSDDPPKREYGKPIAGSLSTIVGLFKSASTRQINQVRETPGEKVWHRGFHDSIIRNERQLAATRAYILNNPLKWALDRANPDRIDR